MKILVVSDTHKNLAALNAIFDANSDADIVVHLGDGEMEFETLSREHPDKAMVYVCGNCDYGDHEISHIIQIGAVKIFCTHGHRFHVDSGVEYLIHEAKLNGCRAALYGHTHVWFAEEIDGVCVMNPGSPFCPREGNKPSYGIMEVSDTGEIKMKLIECKLVI